MTMSRRASRRDLDELYEQYRKIKSDDTIIRSQPKKVDERNVDQRVT